MHKRKKKCSIAAWNESHEQFLIERMAREWDAARRAEKRHEVARQVLDAGKVVGRTLLCMALIGGVVTVAAVAPNVFSAFAGVGKHRRFFNKKELQHTLHNFKQNNLFMFTRIGEGEYRISLTSQGKRRALRDGLERLRLKRARIWDGVWRLVIFDIPRSRNVVRDALRNRLRTIGMEQLQESVFVYPYPCEEEVRFVAALYQANAHIRIIRAMAIDGVSFDAVGGITHIS